VCIRTYKPSGTVVQIERVLHTEHGPELPMKLSYIMQCIHTYKPSGRVVRSRLREHACMPFIGWITVLHGSARARMQTNHTPDDRPDSNKPMSQPLREHLLRPPCRFLLLVHASGFTISNLQRSIAYNILPCSGISPKCI
jgi:hypothetical protein